MGLCILWMVLGGFFYTFTIGNLSSYLSNLDTKESILSDKLMAISAFSKDAKLGKALTADIRKATTYAT